MNATSTTTTTTADQIDHLVEACESDPMSLVWVVYRAGHVRVRIAGRLTKNPLGPGWNLDASTDPMDLILKEISFDLDAVAEVQGQTIHLGSR